MRVCIMTDLEGVACVMNAPDWIYPQSRYYEDGKRLLTEEVNAAVEGFTAAGATKIVVQDGHGHGAINGLLLDERAELQRGWGRMPYPFGVDGGFDCIAWVGQHPKAGTAYGHICHTGSFHVLDVSINDISVGEFGECGFCALEYGVVPIFGSGCEAFAKEARELFPGIGTVAVKRGLMELAGDDCTAEEYEGWNAGAIHLQHRRACRLIRDGAYEALKRFQITPESFSSNFPAAPYTLVMKLRPDKDNPEPRTVTRTHPASVTGLLNRPFER
ncbi:MAG: M55 family metallopeptidase [Clostridiaceae bacterium]|nr:M55 family metallopeptidase [Clostridiaceae bacterium]